MMMMTITAILDYLGFVGVDPVVNFPVSGSTSDAAANNTTAANTTTTTTPTAAVDGGAAFGHGLAAGAVLAREHLVAGQADAFGRDEVLTRNRRNLTRALVAEHFAARPAVVLTTRHPKLRGGEEGRKGGEE